MTDLYPGVIANGLLLIGLLLLAASSVGNSKSFKVLIVCLFAYVNTRYLFWRLDATLPEFSFAFEAFWMWIFFVTEAFAAVALTWHFFVMAAPSNRSDEADIWEKVLEESSAYPSVDIFIPTVNEPLSLLEQTINGAICLDYPKVNIWVLDDGNRDWLQEYCDAVSVNYIARENRVNFKAGNLNNALGMTSANVVCVVDADFVLEKNFLKRTVGLLNDPSVGLVQTPQVFGNPDAVQHNLCGNTAWPESQCTFSDVVQAGRDSWDNAFCYGTSFIVKRECLDAIGGFAIDSITEDLLTSYVLQAAGYKTRFLNEPLSKGVATQDIAEYIAQRCRWCIGTIQCLFVDRGLLRSRSLSLIDRLFFLDPIIYHLGTIWTLLLIISPMMYWWFGFAPFHSDFGHLLVVLAPRMLLVTFGFYWLSNRKTIPIVSEVGRVVGVFYLTSAIFKTLINPFNQSFRITIKHSEETESFVYWKIMAPLAGIIILTVCGFLMRYFSYLDGELLWRTDFGLMVSLTVYVIWLLFLSCLACVQKPISENDPTVYVGSIRKATAAITRRMFA